LRLLRYLRGYVTLLVEGKSLERFINMAVSRGIKLWDVTSLGSNRMLLRVRVGAVGALRHIARRTDSRFRVREKRGLFFWLWRMQRRKAFCGGALFFLAALYIFFSFVWAVEVSGTRRIDPVAIRRAAAAAGLKPGVARWRVNEKDIERHLKEQFPTIAWVGVEVKGGKATVRIAEKRLPAPVPTNPAHIVARKAGLIKELLVLEGQPLVKEGDTVLSGQVLISGEVVPGEGESGIVPGRPHYTRAKGIVRARVWYEGYGEALLVERGERVGRRVTVWMVRVAGREFKIQGPERIPYARYRVRVTVKRPLKWRNFGAPVEFINKEFTELVPYEIRRTETQARRLAEKRAWDALRPSLPAEGRVLSKKYVAVPSGRREAIRVRLKVEVLEDIGQLREFKRP